jgi:hypothetical protein
VRQTKEIFAEYSRMRDNGLDAKAALNVLRYHIEVLSKSDREALASMMRTRESGASANPSAPAAPVPPAPLPEVPPALVHRACARTLPMVGKPGGSPVVHGSPYHGNKGGAIVLLSLPVL